MLTSNLQKVSDRVDTSEGIETKIKSINTYGPRPNRINMNLRPRSEWNLARGKLTNIRAMAELGTLTKGTFVDLLEDGGTEATVKEMTAKSVL